MTSRVDFITATASERGASPSTRAASVLMSKANPVWSPTHKPNHHLATLRGLERITLSNTSPMRKPGVTGVGVVVHLEDLAATSIPATPP